MQNKHSIMKSIRSKLVFSICVLFIFIGVLIYLPLSIILPQKITSQILKRDVEIAKYLSNDAKNLLLLNDRIALSILLHDNLDRLVDAQYLFVQDSDGDIISHTFIKGFPKGLLSFNSDTPYSHRIKGFLSNGRKLYDIAVPISKGELGILHLGVSLESGKKDIAAITKINDYVAIVILIGLGIGILVFLIIGFLFSSQIIKLKDFASKIGRGDLEAKIDVKSKDEIGTLASAFNEMVLHLKEKIQEIKRLNTVEERNKIALDLHDGCIQDLANIIKRLELCEKLFRSDPPTGFKELGALRKTTREVLNSTRQVISDLKLPRDLDFNLLNNLTNYIKSYQNENPINVKLDVSADINNIPSEKSKSIFYIIREALTNVRKHSMARNVELNLQTGDNGNLKIFIEDNGRGFDFDNALLNASNCGKLGLMSMRQRTSSLGGTFNIESKPKQGTRISVNIPLKGSVTIKEL